MVRTRVNFENIQTEKEDPQPDAVIAYHHRDGAGRELTWLLHDAGNHGLGRDLAAHQASGNLRAVQILLGHAKIENTVRYLGVDVEDALTLSEGIEV